MLQLLRLLTEVGAVGDGRGAAALLVAAEHSHDGAGSRLRVDAGDPRAAAGAAGEPVALEPQLGRALLRGPAGTGDRGIGAGRVAGDPDLVPVSGVDAELVGAQHLFDVLPVLG